MDVDRRGFIKMAGIAFVGLLAAKPIFDMISRAEAPKKVVEAETATQTQTKWGMAIKIANCKDGCTDCINACNTIHNVPDIPDPKHEIKWIWDVNYEEVFPEQNSPFLADSLKGLPVLVLCNHCDKPPCTRVCPTGATWKREDGIVMMDYHRCIGCRYCMAGCPFGARSFNWVDPRPYIKNINADFPTRTKGVVEKCNFCEERLAKGLIPACVEACTEKALVFGDLNDPNSDIRKLLATNYSIRRKSELGTEPKVYYVI
jgi:Fe-S-cluster-containing dehydrogenase component